MEVEAGYPHNCNSKSFRSTNSCHVLLGHSARHISAYLLPTGPTGPSYTMLHSRIGDVSGSTKNIRDKNDFAEYTICVRWYFMMSSVYNTSTFSLPCKVNNHHAWVSSPLQYQTLRPCGRLWESGAPQISRRREWTLKPTTVDLYMVSPTKVARVMWYSRPPVVTTATHSQCSSFLGHPTWCLYLALNWGCWGHVWVLELQPGWWCLGLSMSQRVAVISGVNTLELSPESLEICCKMCMCVYIYIRQSLSPAWH